jgi:hypothetical protein
VESGITMENKSGAELRAEKSWWSILEQIGAEE